MALDSEFTAVVQCLGCLGGVSTLTAFGLAMEIGEWDRFTGSSIGAYLGLVPSEHSSGGVAVPRLDRQTCNTHACRLLVGAAWHHRRPYLNPSRLMRARWELAPEAARVRGHAGNRRLPQCWLTYLEHHKRPVIATVAVARELAGWCWSLDRIAELKASAMA